MESPTHAFRKKNLVLHLAQESQIKSKIMMSWSSKKKKSVYFL